MPTIVLARSSNGSPGLTLHWVSPQDVTSVTVECWGGGGAGAGISSSTGAGGGGGGGSYASSVVAVAPSTLFTIVIGAGGTASSTQATTNGAATTFNSTSVVANGGTGVVTGTSTGGNGGTAGTGTTTHLGGKGGTGVAGTDGGGGGGSAGSAGDGGAGGAPTAGIAGAGTGGGAGGLGAQVTGLGIPAQQTGGGGGGALRKTTGTSNGGAGAAGGVRLTYTTAYQATRNDLAGQNAEHASTPVAGQPFFGVNSGVWWYFQVDGTTATQLDAYWAPTLDSSWNLASTTFTSSQNIQDNVGNKVIPSVDYASIAGVDVAHLGWCSVDASTNMYNMHVRATLAGGVSPTPTFGSEIQISTFNYTASVGVPSAGVLIDSLGNVWHTSGGASDGTSAQQNPGAYLSTNQDLGTSWASGFGAAHIYETSGGGFAQLPNYAYAFDLGSGNALHLWSEIYSGTGDLKNMRYAVYNGSWGAVGNVLASDITDAGTVFVDGWGISPRSTSDIHFVVYDGLKGGTHRRFNGTSWVAGDAVIQMAGTPNNARLVTSDGTSVWMLGAQPNDSSTICTSLWLTQWTSGKGWSAWSQQFSLSSFGNLGFVEGNNSVTSSPLMAPVAASDISGARWFILAVVIPIASTPFVNFRDPRAR